MREFPSVLQIKGVVNNCFICITGVVSEIEEVDSYKYIPRVKTPRIREGMVLVITDGIIFTHNKLLKYTKSFNLDWTWLHQLINKQNYKNGLKS